MTMSITEGSFFFTRSTRKEFSTSSKRPPAPSDIRARRVSPDVIQVKWGKMSWPGIFGFRIFYSTEPDPDDMANWERIEIGDSYMASVRSFGRAIFRCDYGISNSL